MGDPFRTKRDPFRPLWWRKPEVFLLGVGVLVAMLMVWNQAWQSEPSDPLAPVAYGTIESINNKPWSGRSLLVQQYFGVRLKSGEWVLAVWAGRDIQGCRIGSKVAIQRRGQNYVVAPEGCSAKAAN
jgi:hypothetical protein